MQIITTVDGAQTVVDDDVYKWASQFKWRLNKYGYVSRREGPSKRIFLHREIMQTQAGYVTDHINGDKLTNLRSNLRITTDQENHWNQPQRRKDNTSGYKGVWYRKDRKRWTAEVHKNGVKYALGCYDTAQEAALAYNAKAKLLFGLKAILNSI